MSLNFKNYFIIQAKLPSLNDYITACRTNKYTGAKFKKTQEILIGGYINQAKNKTLKPVVTPVKVVFEWHEKTAKRDADNIASAKKFILDALQEYGILINDNQKYVKGFTDEFVKDTKDFVVVELVEC
ncbi:MAG: RusA family crossover junction endodeoxyribonuclease [Treponema sp.]|nr:RusA family crossover junction endodeoxyribonuclease [Treponema sp.]MBP3630249.1 RusA family crossover junction endodeoxyribonuclease [Clostridia bacterium]